MEIAQALWDLFGPLALLVLLLLLVLWSGYKLFTTVLVKVTDKITDDVADDLYTRWTSWRGRR